MLCGAFSFHGKSKLAVMEALVNASKHCRVLDEYLIPAGQSIYRNGYISQQDNASGHTALKTKDWLADKGIEDLPWLAKSPDLNPIEKMCGILARSVYQNARQFSPVEELNQVIYKTWDEIPDETYRNLVNSMSKRCAEVLAAQGRKINYYF